MNLVVGRYLGMIVGVIRGVLVPRVLDPATYGIYKTFLIIPVYVRAGHLGAVSGLSRQIPFYLGKGDDESLKASVRVAYTFSLGSALLSCLFLIGYSFRFPQMSTRVALWVFLFFVVSGQQSKLQETYLLGYQKFIAVSRLNLAQNIYSTIFAVIGAWSFGLMGVIVATALDGVLTLFLFRKVSGIGFPGLSLDRTVTKELLSVGSPLLVTGLLNNLLLSIDKLVIVKFLGMAAMGYYSLAATFVLYMNDLSNLLSRVVFPKMVVRLGADEPLERITAFIHLPVAATSYSFPILVIWVHYFCVWGFRWIFPRYEPGAAVMEILTFSILPYSHFLSHMNLVVAMKKQLKIVWMYPVSIAVTAAIALVSVWRDWGIQGVALGAVLGMFIFSIQLYFYSERKLLTNPAPWGRFWRSYGPTFWVAVIVTADGLLFRGGSQSVALSLARAVAVTALFAPVVVWAWFRDREFQDIVGIARRYAKRKA